MIIFGFVFLIIFSGIGGFVTWASMRGTKNRKTRLQDEQNGGIDSDQKVGSWVIAAFGGVFLVFGGGMSLIVLPDAIRNGQYAALFVLVFAFIGAAIVYHAFKLNRAYRRFGPTPMFLDPAVPGVGGQLGGQFSVNAPGICVKACPATELRARLTCTRKSKSGKSTSYSVKWQEEAPVYVIDTANGVDASFLFEIPDSCTPSKEWSRGSSIEWNVTVEGEFGSTGLGKFERCWEVDVEDSAAEASNVLRIPQSFLQKATQRTDDRVKTSALDQVLIVEDNQYLTVHSKAGRHLGAKIVGMLFGAVFAGMGIFTILQNWWPGYIFLLVGSAIGFISLFTLGKSIKVVIDKDSRVLYTRESWFGLAYARRQGDVLDPHQFKIKNTSSSSTHNKVTEYYAVNFEIDGNTIRIADGIEGKKEALALKDAIVNRSFNEEQQSLPA